MSASCGTTAGYRAHKVRREPTCRPCKDAQAQWQREYEKRRYITRGTLMVDGTGTRRRLRALVAIGWSFGELGERLGVDQASCHRYSTRDRVFRTTADKVAALYDELSMIPGKSQRARMLSKKKGWLPPLDLPDEWIDDPTWRPGSKRGPRTVDDVAVERAMRGDRVHLRPVERREAVQRLTVLGLSAAEIADRLGVSDRTVTRARVA